MVKADFCASVNTFFDFLALGLGFAFALFVFAGFGLALIRGFALVLALIRGFALGTAFGVVFLGAGLAAFVFEVVGAFLAVVVVLPVWALGRDTAFCA